MAQAAEHIVSGEYTAAEKLYRDLLTTGEDPDVALALVDLYIEWHRPDLGLATLKTAVTRGVSSSKVITQQLTLLLQNDQWSQAAQAVQTHLNEEPPSSFTLHALTTAYLELGQCSDARVTAVKMWQADAHNDESTLTYSILNEDSDTLCTIDSDLCSIATQCEQFCYAEIGVKLIKLNKWSLANCVLQHAVKLDPENATVHAWLGESMARLNQPQAAEAHFYESIEIDPANPLGWLLLGTHAYKTGDWETARAALLNAQRLDPENPAPCLGIAELKAAQGSYTEVDTWIKAALERAVNDIDIWKAAARIYITRNLIQADLPLRIAEGAVKLNPQDAEAHLLIGWTYLLKGDADLSLPAIEQAIELDASSGQAYYLRGVLLEHMGNSGEAETAFIRAADLGYFP